MYLFSTLFHVLHFKSLINLSLNMTETSDEQIKCSNHSYLIMQFSERLSTL